MRSGANSGTASSAGELSISCDGAIGVERTQRTPSSKTRSYVTGQAALGCDLPSMIRAYSL